MATNQPQNATNNLSRPLVSVIVANYNSEKFVEQAIASVTGQTLRDIEIVIVDDASTDGCVGIIKQLAQLDSRIRLIEHTTNSGPAAARNCAIRESHGEWIAVFDSDDLMHPDRLRLLTEAAAIGDNDIIADDLLIFQDKGGPTASLLGARTETFLVTAQSYLESNHLYGRPPALGYLKPLFRRSFIEINNVRYDEALRIAEDFDFVLRLLLKGARFIVQPQLLYFYRKHSNSISHRLTINTLEAIAIANERMSLLASNQGLSTEFAKRSRSISNAISYEKIIRAVKNRDVVTLVRLLFAQSGALPLLRFPILSRLRILTKRKQPAPRSIPSICVFSRQRVTGSTNGSSKYLLSIVNACAKNGFEVHYLSPSPATLGRWPYLRMSSEMNVFSSIKIRRTLKIGQLIISLDARLFIDGALASAEKILLKIGLIRKPIFKNAPYAIASTLTKLDQLYLAHHAPRVGDILIADYCFLTSAFPYSLRPDASTFVLMHDLFSSRSEQFEKISTSDSVVLISETEELNMLSAANSIIAIQKEEASYLGERIHERSIITAPLAAYPVDSARVGGERNVLFVGSSAAPNVDGLRWFIELCWPVIRGANEGIILNVAGSVCNHFSQPVSGINFLGQIKDLSILYESSSVVISPLRVGSGLKIKLIEGMAQGKAMVVTSKTLQGVEQILGSCCLVADDPYDFASATLAFIEDIELRERLGSLAIRAIGKHFSDEACYGPLIEAISQQSLNAAH